MNLLKKSRILMLIMVLTFSLASCSGSSKSQSPLVPDTQASDLPLNFSLEDTSGRSVLAVYDAVIAPSSRTFTITPVDRTVQFHFPLTQMYPNVLQVTAYGFTPGFWADIRLTHPLPGSGIDAFDPRVIAILPANPGVSFNYSFFDVRANNSVLPEPDGYTKLFDVFLPPVPGNANPFMAYFKDQPYRRWSSSGTTSETLHWNMDLSGFGGPIQFKLVVDVSTNYPNPPTPINDNIKEPYRIEAFTGGGLTPDGGSTPIKVSIFDWQGPTGMGGVQVECPSLFYNVVSLFFVGPGTYPNEYIFQGTISNNLHAPAGKYNLLVSSSDSSGTNYVYDEFPVYVHITPTNPVDVTPDWLNFSPYDVCIDGSYAYIAGYVNGLHIFSISDPLNPQWLKKIDTPGDAYAVRAAGGYVYVADNNAGLAIIDVEPLSSAHLVKSVTMPGQALNVCLNDKYAYVANASYGLSIINIDLPPSAYLVKTVNTPDNALSVDVDNGYAFVADKGTGMTIIDVVPPETAFLMYSVDTPGDASGVDVFGGYAFVADSFFGMHIIDIDPITSASIVKTVDTSGLANCVHEFNGYAYVGDGESGLAILDVNPISSASIVKYVPSTGFANGIAIGIEHAYVADKIAGLITADIIPPELAYQVDIVDTPGMAYDVDVAWWDEPDYVVVADDAGGVLVVDVAPTDSASIIGTCEVGGNANSVSMSGSISDEANVSNGESVLSIDLSDPNNPSILMFHSFNTDGEAHGAIMYETSEYDEISGYYNYFMAALVAEGEEGFGYYNNNALFGAWQKSDTVNTDGFAWGISEQYLFDFNFGGDYVFVTDILAGLYIIYFDPPDFVFPYSVVETPGQAFNVAVNYDDVEFEYVYVADYNAGLQIVDINPPDSAFIAKSVPTVDIAFDVFVSGDYAYVADGEAGLVIISINPPETAGIIEIIDTPGWAHGVAVADYDGLAYVADSAGGLRIIHLGN